MQYDEKTRIRDVSSKDGLRATYFGRVTRCESRYAFAEMDGAGDRVFIHSDTTDGAIFESLRPGDRVQFCLGFSFSGLQALDATKVGAS
jgi:cold shock CspA family protein